MPLASEREQRNARERRSDRQREKKGDRPSLTSPHIHVLWHNMPHRSTVGRLCVSSADPLCDGTTGTERAYGMGGRLAAFDSRCPGNSMKMERVK